MQATIIGISLGIIIISLFMIFKNLEIKTFNALVLSGIGFLYVGFVWTDIQAVAINAIQAVIFLLIAYLGVKKNPQILSIGYFLHGLWDYFYHFFQNASLIPPHYEMFCLSVDFTIAFYLFIVFSKAKKLSIGSRIQALSQEV